jgi:tetratricopeptide (TPR) repeat protein
MAHEDSGPVERARELATFTHDLGRYEEALAHRIAAGRGLAVDTFENAFDLYLAGQFEPARLKWQIVASNASGAAKARALYWMARAYDQLGEREQAAGAFAQARATSPNSYYGILAQSRLLERGEELPLALSEPGKGEQARVQWKSPWIDGPSSFAAALGPPDDPWTRGPATGAVPFTEGLAAMTTFSGRYGALFPAAATATALYRIGAIEPARIAVRDAASEMLLLDRAFGAGKRSSLRKPIRLGTRRWEHWIDNRGSNERGFWGIALRDLRFPVPAARDDLQAFVARHEEIRSNKTSIIRTMAPMLRAADDYAMLRHFISRGHFGGTDIVSSRDRTPMAYGRELDRCARDRNLNPFFIWSIMTIESDLNADSVSVADAYGLLQVIPKTGELMADRFGKGTFGIYDLLTPRDAATYGCHYLATLVDKFKGQELIAAAAYNAGPHQLARWMQWRGDRLALDEFIETIPYGATRLYPQKMLATMAKYRSLYGPKTPLYISNKMDVTFGNDIYF